MTKGTAAAVPFAEVEKISPTADEPPETSKNDAYSG
jgi:hypothetical protein